MPRSYLTQLDIELKSREVVKLISSTASMVTSQIIGLKPDRQKITDFKDSSAEVKNVLFHWALLYFLFQAHKYHYAKVINNKEGLRLFERELFTFFNTRVGVNGLKAMEPMVDFIRANDDRKGAEMSAYGKMVCRHLGIQNKPLLDQLNRTINLALSDFLLSIKKIWLK